MEGRVTFKFTHSYKHPRMTLGYLRFELVHTNKHLANRPPMSTMARTQAQCVKELYPTQEELYEVVAVPKLPKSPHTLLPRKDKQNMGPVQVSQRFNKLSIVEKEQRNHH